MIAVAEVVIDARCPLVFSFAVRRRGPKTQGARYAGAECGKAAATIVPGGRRRGRCGPRRAVVDAEHLLIERRLCRIAGSGEVSQRRRLELLTGNADERARSGQND